MKLKAVLRYRESEHDYADWVYTEHSGMFNLTVFMHVYDEEDECDTVSCSSYRFKSRDAGNAHYMRFVNLGCVRLDMSNRTDEIPALLDDVRDVIRHSLVYPVTSEFFINK